MKSPEIPARAWQSITMNFITKLPEFKDSLTGVKYDMILVITDRLIKYACFLPVRETITAEDLAGIFLREVFAKWGMPAEIVSDRDKLFISKFWGTLMRRLRTERKMLTAFHP